METNSRPEKEVSTSKQGQYRPRRKDTTPKVNPQLAVELVYQELKRVEAYTKRIEDATSKKVQIDGENLESAEKRLKNVLADFERQGNRMKTVAMWINGFRSTPFSVPLSPSCLPASCVICGWMLPKTGITTNGITSITNSR